MRKVSFAAGDEERMVRYLLGELPEEERDQLEERFFEDEDYFARLAEAEHQLIDRFLRGALTGEDRARFERTYLNEPKRRERVEFARSLRARLVAESGRSRMGLRAAWQEFLASLEPAARYALAGSAAMLVLGGSWLAWENVRLRGQIALTRENMNARIVDLTAKSEEQRARLARLESGSAAASFLLAPGLLRGAESKRLAIPADAQTVRFQLLAEPVSGASSYRASVRTPEGTEVWSEGSLKAQAADSGSIVGLNVPAGLVATGEYVIRLEAQTARGAVSLESYSFSARPRARPPE